MKVSKLVELNKLLVKVAGKETYSMQVKRDKKDGLIPVYTTKDGLEIIISRKTLLDLAKAIEKLTNE